jgi:NAD(P)-dependent dehydrogenase (short-subunit alcohol dehydrogenase family)
MVFQCVEQIHRILDMRKLNKQVALITGGNSGLGLATAKLLAAEAAQVIITGRRKAAVDEAAAAIGHSAVGLQSDASDLQDIDHLYSEIGGRCRPGAARRDRQGDKRGESHPTVIAAA